MGEKSTVTTVHIIEGRPWKDVLIRVLEPESPLRPWYASRRIKRGDAVIVVLDTDPVSVLAGVGIVESDGDVDGAIAAIDRTKISGLIELSTLNMLADVEVAPSRETVYRESSLDKVVALLGNYNQSTSDALSGHNSLAAGRVLLESNGTCTGCERELDLRGEGARDRVHIHTVSRTQRPLNEEDADADWPAALCEICTREMRQRGITNFLEYRFSLNPWCPECCAERTCEAMYGMPTGPVEEPWIAVMGCCWEPYDWVCAACGHQWASD